jgi:FkbM family methyltransferase
MIVAGKSGLRRLMRAVGRRLPGLRALSGRLGLGRLLAPQGTVERLILDEDVTIALDLSVPIYRYVYFNHDLANVPELGIIPAFLSSEGVFVDVGAHIGYFGLVGAKYSSRAYLFEPGNESYVRLMANIALNPKLASRITARKVAIAAEPGQLTLFTSADGPDTASFRPLTADTIGETVPVSTLDAEIPPDASVALVKIDVEGAEMDVLNGAKRILTQWQPAILIELYEKNQRAFGRTCASLVARLEDAGYVGFELTGSRSRPRLVDLEVRTEAREDIVNAVFVPPSKLDALTKYRK